MPVEPMHTNSARSCFPPGNGAARLTAWLRPGYEYAAFYISLALLAGLLLAWNVLAAIFGLALPRRSGAVLGRRVITLMARGYLFALTRSGFIKLDLDALDALRDERSLIIAPNHPALLDVVLMVSRLPHAVCIMKAKLGENVFLSGAVNLAGYIRNDSAVTTIRRASTAVRAGGQLLIFPEGTRTARKPVNPFKGGFALIAKTARAPVQTVFIESNSPFLGKGWSLFKKPDFPLIYRARLGRRFEVDGEVKTFVSDLEGYYREALEPAA
jgi:1-acyl-sn-glycerol-3-phosphate acyltransferase